jgi:hypothetical protein
VDVLEAVKEVRDGKWGPLTLEATAKLNEIALHLAQVKADLERRTTKLPPWLGGATQDDPRPPSPPKGQAEFA